MSNPNKRDSSIEILRIIAMFFIVFYHYIIHGGFDLDTSELSINKYILQIFQLGKVGVDIFVLITGYFMIHSKYSFKKVIKLVSQVQFYTIGFYVIFLFAGAEKFSIFGLISKIFPTAFYQYWFFTAYIVLYIFTPYINKFLKGLLKKEHLHLIIIMLIMWSLMPTLKISNMYGSEVLQFFMLYCIGAYIKLHMNFSKNIIRRLGIVLVVVCGGVMMSSVIVFDVLGIKYAVFMRNAIQFYGQESIFVIGVSVGLLLLFSQLEIGTNKFINLISSCTFGIYLIQSNQQFYSVLYKSFLQSYKYQNSGFLLMHMLICSIGIFAVCASIEFLRKQSVEKIIMVLVKKYYDRIRSLIKNKMLVCRKMMKKLLWLEK